MDKPIFMTNLLYTGASVMAPYVSNMNQPGMCILQLHYELKTGVFKDMMIHCPFGDVQIMEPEDLINED